MVVEVDIYTQSSRNWDNFQVSVVDILSPLYCLLAGEILVLSEALEKFW